jgi:hypothetical protein
MRWRLASVGSIQPLMHWQDASATLKRLASDGSIQPQMRWQNASATRKRLASVDAVS